MPRRRGRSRRGGAYHGTGGGKKVLSVAQAAANPERPVSVARGTATALAARRTRLQHSPTHLKISTEEQFRTLRGDLKRVGIITAALIAVLFIVWWVL